MAFQMKTLRGKYQIKPNTFVSCYLEVEEATEREWRVYVGITRRADRRLPAGAKIFIDPQSLRQAEGPASRPSDVSTFETLSLVVRETLTYDGSSDPVHICGALGRQTHANRRAVPRREAAFPMALGEDYAWQVINASTQGLALTHQAQTPVVPLALGREYAFQTLYKGRPYSFAMRLRHVDSNWETFVHTLGFELGPMSADEETVLNLLIDPSYTITLRDSSVDADEGRIRGA